MPVRSLLRRSLVSRLLAPALVATALTGATVTTVAATAGPALACGSATPSASYAASLPRLDPGDRGPFVLALQMDLHGRYGEKYVHADGAFGPQTAKGLAAFQRRHGVTGAELREGYVGRDTWTALVGHWGLGLTRPSAAGQVPSGAVTPGERDRADLARLDDVIERVLRGHDLKLWLHQAAAYPDVYTGAEVGVVRGLQSLIGIPTSGTVGKATYTALYEITSATGGWGC